MENQPQAAQPKPHGLIIGLLFAILLLTLAVVAIVVMNAKTKVTEQAYSMACKAQVEAAVLDGAREITRACQTDNPTPTVTTGQVPPGEGIVGFDYPLGWSVETTFLEPTSGNGSTTWVAKMVPGYFSSCNGCDGPFIDISMYVGSRSYAEITKHTDFNAYLQSYYSDSNVFKNIAITPSKDVGGERYTVTGTSEGLYSGPFETIYFEGSSLYASLTFMDSDTASSVTNEAWTIVKESLDFSGLQK
jgi:type II secretory pathway pseudopilin PulG